MAEINTMVDALEEYRIRESIRTMPETMSESYVLSERVSISVKKLEDKDVEDITDYIMRVNKRAKEVVAQATTEEKEVWRELYTYMLGLVIRDKILLQGLVKLAEYHIDKYDE